MRLTWKGLLSGAGVLLLLGGTADASSIYLGHEYQVVLSTGLTWSSARAAALTLGSGWDLATIGDAGENTFVKGLLNTSAPDRSHFWIGATDEVTEGNWLWVDGTPF